MRRQWLIVLGFFSLSCSGQWLWANSEKPPTLLVFTANWCASCRDIMPAVQSVASAKGYLLQIVDVDQEIANNLAHGYGLTLNKLEPPQIYLVNPGKTPLLLLDQSSDVSQAAGILQQKLLTAK